PRQAKSGSEDQPNAGRTISRTPGAEIAIETCERLRRQFVRGPPLPVPFRNRPPEALGLALRVVQQLSLVSAEYAAVLHDRAAIHDHALDVVAGRALHERLDRISIRPDAEGPEIHDDDVRLRAGREPTEVVAPERARAAERGRGEGIGRRRGQEIALDDLADERRPAHLADQVARIRIGAEPERDPALAIA